MSIEKFVEEPRRSRFGIGTTLFTVTAAVYLGALYFGDEPESQVPTTRPEPIPRVADQNNYSPREQNAAYIITYVTMEQ